MATLIRVIRPHVELHRDPKSGIAWVKDGEAGIGHSAHPNISTTGSVRGMRERGTWGAKDRVVRSHGFAYNTSIVVSSDALDEIARSECRCGGQH